MRTLRSSRKSTGSASKTSGPPLASSWAAPPEFYLDENITTRSIRRLLVELGYCVHTPAELYGSREAALGAADTDWLERVGRQGWVVIGRDLHILQRPFELDAYRRAGIHMFLLPGEALAAELCELLEANLTAICAESNGRKPGVWRITRHGLQRL